MASASVSASTSPLLFSSRVVRTPLMSPPQGKTVLLRPAAHFIWPSREGDLMMVDPTRPVRRTMRSDANAPLRPLTGPVDSPHATRWPAPHFMRTVVGLALVSLLLSALACGGDSAGSESAFNYVLAYETQIAVLDMAAMSEDTAPGSLADKYAEMSTTFGVLGVQAEDMDTLVMAENSRGGSDFVVFEGYLSFGNIRDVLHNNQLWEDTFRGVEIWEDFAAQGGAAIFEEAGVFVIGDNRSVKEVIRAVEGGYGSIADADETNIRRVLDAAGRGWILVAYADGEGPCWGIGCEAWASAIADGEREYDVKQTVVALFSTESEAESNADKVEDSLNDNWEVGGVTVDGVLVTVEATADEDDVEWSRLLDPF